MSFATHLSKRFVAMTKYVGPLSKTRKYEGPFIYKRHPVVRTNIYEMDEMLERLKQIRDMEIKEPSPFHIVMRYKPMSGRPWYEKVVLRRLGLHSKENGEPVLLPNTPNFNKLLWEVKHLIKLKPVRFPDGIPTEKDIGATKMDPYTGVMRISEAFRVSDEQLYGDKVMELYGKYLSDYLKDLSGIFKNY